MLLLVHLALAGAYEDAQAQLVAGHCDQALSTFDKALHKEPEDARAAVGRALCLATEKRDDEAISELRALVSPSGRVIVEGAKHSLSGLKGDERTYTERQLGDAILLLVERKYTQETNEILVNAERIAGVSAARTMAQTSLERSVQGDEAGWAWLVRRFDGHQEDPEWVAALGRYIRRSGAGVPTQLEQAVLQKGDADTLYELIGGLYNSKDYKRCLADVELVGDRFPEAALFGYRCALLAGDATKIPVYRTKVGTPPPTAEGMLDASLSVQRGDYAAAESLLTTVVPKTDADLARIATVRVQLYTKQGRWDDARLAAATKGVDVKTVTSLAVAMARAGRRADAQALLKTTCPTLPDPTAQSACLAMVP